MVLEVDDIAFILIVVAEMLELSDAYEEPGLRKEILALSLGMILRQVRFLLLRHFVVGVIVRIQHLDLLDGLLLLLGALGNHPT